MGGENGTVKKVFLPHATIEKTWTEVEVYEEELAEIYAIFEKRKAVKWITIHDILKQVSNYTSIPIETILKKTRKRDILEPRQMAMYLCRKHTQNSLSEIGLKIGGKNHSTVSHASQNIENLIETNPEFREKWKGLL